VKYKLFYEKLGNTVLMKGYKYRGVLDKCILQRDLKTFLSNKFYASRFETMNDKFEANFDENITDTFTSLEKQFNVSSAGVQKEITELTNFKDTLGIYCLSKTY
jgi:hypothetical protein